MAIVCAVVTAAADSLCAQERTLLARIESAKATGSPADDAKLAREIYDMFVAAETAADANSLGSSWLN